MALTRKFLSGMGIEDKQIESIIEAHSDTVTALKNERDQYREQAEKVPDLQRQLEEAKSDTSLADLQKKYDASESANKKVVRDLTKERDEASKALEAMTQERDSIKAELEKASAEHSAAMEAKQAELEAAVTAAQGERDGIQSQFDEYKAQVTAQETARAVAQAYRKQVLEQAGIAPMYIDDLMEVSKLDGIELDDEGNIKDVDGYVDAAKNKWGTFVVKHRTEPAEVEEPPAQPMGTRTVEGAHERALQIAQERHERLYGKSEE